MQALLWLAAILAGVVHVLIFCMESLWWTTPRVRQRFRQTPEQAEATKLLAFNQGFYNLFLALGVFAGSGAAAVLRAGGGSLGDLTEARRRRLRRVDWGRPRIAVSTYKDAP